MTFGMQKLLFLLYLYDQGLQNSEESGTVVALGWEGNTENVVAQGHSYLPTRNQMKTNLNFVRILAVKLDVYTHIENIWTINF
jgi:hypothetical protein